MSVCLFVCVSVSLPVDFCTVKFLKPGTPKIITQFSNKMEQLNKDSDEKANSIDLDQSAPSFQSSLIKVCTVCPGSVLILEIFMVIQKSCTIFNRLLKTKFSLNLIQFPSEFHRHLTIGRGINLQFNSQLTL